MTKKFRQLRRETVCGRAFSAIMISLSVLALGGTAIAQEKPPLMNPPALPATSRTGSFGPTLTAPGITPSFPAPNTTTWTALGPAPLNEGGSASGRIAGVAVDPTNSNNIYVAAAGGGDWQGTDGGAPYHPLPDTQSVLAMGAIAIAPSNLLKSYAGTGEANTSLDSDYGLGILVSNDGGASWTLSTGPGGVFTNFRLAVSKISVDPTTANTAYAAINDYAENGVCCSNTGIYKTTDGGITWTNVTSAASLDSSRPWSDVAVDPNSPSIVYAAHGDPFNANATNGVYRSLDGGSTWALLANCPHGANGRIALAVAPSASTTNSHVLYVAIATALGSSSVLFEMLVSNNADATTPTFTNLTSTPNFGGSGGQAWYDWIIAVDPSNALNVYAAGALNYNNNTDQVIRTINGGTSWTDITKVSGIQPHTDSHAMAFNTSNRLLLGNDGGLWRFDPAGPSWTNLNGTLNTIQFTGIGVHPTNNQIVVGGSQDNGTELTSSSATWNSTDGGDGGYSQISQTNGLICYSNHPIGSFGSTAFFRVSTDGCNTFAARTPTISNSSLFNFYAPIFVDTLNGNRVFLGGARLYESTTAGTSGTNHTSPATTPINSISVLPGGNTIYISTGGTLAVSSPQIWVSTTDGASWTQHNLPVGGAVQEVDVDPNDLTGNTAVAVINTFNGANGQVFRTINGGTLWSNISGNLPVLPTWSAKIDTDAGKTIYVSNETGVYSSPSPYGTWAAVGTGLPHAQGVHLELNSSLHELAVATHGRGAWYFSTSTSTASPTIAKAFNPTTIQSGGSSVVTLTLSNSNASALTAGAFTDTLANMRAVGGAGGGTCAGTTPSSLSAGATALSFTGITIPASSSCTVTFSVTSSTPGVQPNSTSGVTTTQTPTGTASNSATLTVLAAPTIAKGFNPTSIASGGSSVVTLTLSNSNGSALTGGALTDTLANMSAVGGAVGGTCTGTTPSSLSAGATALSFTGITIPSGSCTVTFSVTSSTVGGNNNTTSGVTTTQTPTAGTASNTATLTVTSISSPTIAKAVNPTTIQSGGSSVVTLTLSNSNASALTAGAFTDTLANMSAVGGAVGGTCAGTTPSSLSAGATALSFTGITIPSGSCTVTFSVTSSTAGVRPNSTSGVTTTQTPTGTASNSANLTVLAAPTIAKGFNPTSIASGGSSVVTLTLSNSNGSALTDSVRVT